MILSLRLKKCNVPPFYTQLKADHHGQDDSLHLLPDLLPWGPLCAPRIYAQRIIESAKDGHSLHLMGGRILVFRREWLILVNLV